MIGNNPKKDDQSKIFLPEIKNLSNRNFYHRPSSNLNSFKSRSSFDCNSVSSFGSLSSKPESEYRNNYVKNRLSPKNAPKFLPKTDKFPRAKYEPNESKFLCLKNSKYYYFPFDSEFSKLRKKYFDTENPISKYQYHFVSYCSYNYITTVLKIYEEMIINYLSDMNFDRHLIPRIHFSRVSKAQFNKVPLNSYDRFVNSRRKKVSELIEMAAGIIDIIQHIRKRKEKNNFKTHRDYLNDSLLDSLDFKFDTNSIFSIEQSNSVTSEDLIDPYEEYTKWVAMCTDELKNWT
ncbi:hypothetical protein BpHYR1_027838 [Brachionus plicatilis]|uniref:Uncharacterized protein n=1 Tax=Brachionus plicatilis TaxID=10195 RepID=A0A3M7QEC2_BRAPC|nr:hypothetical protein BpHYR1_027838 [Brachionus plicatilis]